MKCKWPALLWLGVTVTCFPAGATTLHISPQGSDAWSGTIREPNPDRTDGPLASLPGARDAIRALRKNSPLTEPVSVIVAEGEYFLAEPFLLEPSDSGTTTFTISYEAAPHARPVFTGGRRIRGWSKGDDGIWTTEVPAVARGDWYFEQLWVNGRRAIRAREPDAFYYYTRGKVGHAPDPRTGRPADLTGRAFLARAEDIADVPSNTDVTLVLYHSWEVTRLRVAAIDRDRNMVVTTAPTPWGFEQWGSSQRYHLENFPAALDTPGEWFLDRRGRLSYLPRPGEDMATAEVIAPVTEAFVRLAGRPERGEWVEHIRLKGLAFRHSQYVLPEQGHGDGQSEVTIPAVFMADGTRHTRIEECEIAHIGIYSIWFRRGCRDCTVTRSYLHDLGAGGIRVGETVIRPDPAERTGQITADNNIIHGGGRIHLGAHGVWIGQSPSNQVTHNDISDFFYTLVSVGWRWGYAESLTHHSTIDFNHLHHAGWGVLSDMGAVYTLGPSPGTTVSHNHIHHVYSYDRYGRGGWGLYNDEGSSDILMENNLVHHVKTGTYHQHYGRDNVVRNNILAFSMDGQLQRSRKENHLSFSYSNNIVYWDQGPFVTAGNINDDQVKLERNLYWNASGAPVDFQGLTLAERQAKGWDQGSIIQDPRFVDPQNGDFRFRPDSPYRQIGFKPFDYTKAGVYGDPEWIGLAQSFSFLEVHFAPEPPPPPPLEFSLDFEAVPVGSQPAEARSHIENKGDQIAVTGEIGAGGSRQSLKITDAPGLQFAFNPHFFWSPHHQGGVTTCSFDLRVEEGVILYHEWRDDATPYRVGPSIGVRDGTLHVPGKTPVPLPAGEWVRFRVRAGLGDASTGTWEVRVTLPGQDPVLFEGLKANPDWKKLAWLGFSSNGTESKSFYLDNIQLKNAVSR